MSTNWLQKLALAVAGLSAAGIGVAIVTVPRSFYAMYGIDLGTDPSLVNELRAPGANLLALGVIILGGIFNARLASLSAVLAVTIFPAYAFGRIVSMAIDGMPSSGLVDAVLIEIGIGGLCLAAFGRHLFPRQSEHSPLGASG